MILEYFLKSYSQVLADFFRTQAKHVNQGIDVLSQIKPVSDGGAPNFLELVLKVFSACFKYQAPLSVAQFFDSNQKKDAESLVATKSQLVIDILNYGLSYQAEHNQSLEGLPQHMISVQERQKGEDELLSRV